MSDRDKNLNEMFARPTRQPAPPRPSSKRAPGTPAEASHPEGKVSKRPAKKHPEPLDSASPQAIPAAPRPAKAPAPPTKRAEDRESTGAGRKAIMIYPPITLATRFKAHAIEQGVPYAQVALAAVAFIAPDITKYFTPVHAGLFDDLESYRARTHEEKEGINLRLMPHHLNTVNDLWQATDGCASRNHLFLVAIEAYLPKDDAQ